MPKETIHTLPPGTRFEHPRWMNDAEAMGSRTALLLLSDGVLLISEAGYARLVNGEEVKVLHAHDQQPTPA